MHFRRPPIWNSSCSLRKRRRQQTVVCQLRAVNAVQQMLDKRLQQLAEHDFSYPLTAREGNNLKPERCMTADVASRRSQVDHIEQEGQALNWESKLYRTLTKSSLDNQVKMNLHLKIKEEEKLKEQEMIHPPLEDDLQEMTSRNMDEFMACKTSQPYSSRSTVSNQNPYEQQGTSCGLLHSSGQLERRYVNNSRADIERSLNPSKEKTDDDNRVNP